MPKKKTTKKPKDDEKQEKENPAEEFDKLLKDRENNQDISQSLRKIYDEDDEPALVVANNEKTPAPLSGDGTSIMAKPKKIKRKEKNPWGKIAATFLFLLFILVGISWTSFYIFNQGSRLNTKDIKLEIEGPDEVIAGEEVVYNIQYKNLGEYNLEDVDIIVNFPDSFVLIDSVPEFMATDAENLEGKPSILQNIKVWEIGQLASSRSSRIQIKGKIIAPPDSKEKIAASITYRPENFSSDFSAEADKEIKVTSTGINYETEAPSFFNLNEEAEIVVKYTKQKENFMDNFKIILEHPDSFIISGDNKSGQWLINEVKEAEQILKFSGAFASKPEAGEKLKILAVSEETFLNTDSAEVKQNYVFYEYEIMPIVTEGALTITLTANGSTADKPVNFGDTITYVAHYKNSSDASLKNIIIMAVIDAKVVDWESIDSNKGELKDGSIIWTKEEISDLEKISPDEEDSFSFSLKIKPRAEIKDMAAKDFYVKTSIDYSIDSSIRGDSAPVAQITNKINSDLKFSGELRYFDREGVAIGEGPLPPKVGEKTVYRAYWTLTNDLHDLTDIETSTILPSYVRWENNYNNSLGGVIYNTESRIITWKIDNWDAIDEPAMMDFGISITPADAEKNKILTILNEASVQAKDAETGGVISLSIKAKTSNLDDDTVGKGYGKVE